MSDPILHVVLYQPEIPPNTGNIGRTCVAVGARLHLVKPLGFDIGEKAIRRSGLDYWRHLDLSVAEDWDEAVADLPSGCRPWVFTKHAERTPWEAGFERGDVLLFGRESVGLPPEIRDADPDRRLAFPMRPQVRSLNLASTAAAAVYEAVRQIGADSIGSHLAEPPAEP